MDDYNMITLQESNNEWVSRLVSILTPSINSSINELLKEAIQLCVENDEEEKYLMTFQNFLTRIPEWNNELIQKQVKHIEETSSCQYLSDLITCVHIIMLKIMTCIRVGQKQKTINIEIPELAIFIHKIYIYLARKLYSNVYLFEVDITPLEHQKHQRELDIIIKESILEAIRESIPVSTILKTYLHEYEEEITEEQPEAPTEPAANDTTPVPDAAATTESATNDTTPVPDTSAVNAPESDKSKTLIGIDDSTPSLASPTTTTPTLAINTTLSPEPPASPTSLMDNAVTQNIKFSDIDEHQNSDNTIENKLVSKEIPNLERISEINNEKRKLAEAMEDDDDEEKIKISDDLEDISLNIETL